MARATKGVDPAVAVGIAAGVAAVQEAEAKKDDAKNGAEHHAPPSKTLANDIDRAVKLIPESERASVFFHLMRFRMNREGQPPSSNCGRFAIPVGADDSWFQSKREEIARRYGWGNFEATMKDANGRTIPEGKWTFEVTEDEAALLGYDPDAVNRERVAAGRDGRKDKTPKADEIREQAEAIRAKRELVEAQKELAEVVGAGAAPDQSLLQKIIEGEKRIADAEKRAEIAAIQSKAERDQSALQAKLDALAAKLNEPRERPTPANSAGLEKLASVLETTISGLIPVVVAYIQKPAPPPPPAPDPATLIANMAAAMKALTPPAPPPPPQVDMVAMIEKLSATMKNLMPEQQEREETDPFEYLERFKKMGLLGGGEPSTAALIVEGISAAEKPLRAVAESIWGGGARRRHVQQIAMQQESPVEQQPAAQQQGQQPGQPQQNPQQPAAPAQKQVRAPTAKEWGQACAGIANAIDRDLPPERVLPEVMKRWPGALAAFSHASSIEDIEKSLINLGTKISDPRPAELASRLRTEKGQKWAEGFYMAIAASA
jgi:hypothetical protein